jgi:nucleotide-binding universal stress UspA family protein
MFKNVLVGVDGRPNGRDAIALARHLTDPIDVMLKEANDRLQELGDVDARAVYGLTGEELAELGDEVDMLVAGSRGYGPVKRLVLGSTSEYLERRARCSLLVLPRGVGASDSASGGGGGEEAYALERGATNA